MKIRRISSNHFAICSCCEKLSSSIHSYVVLLAHNNNNCSRGWAVREESLQVATLVVVAVMSSCQWVLGGWRLFDPHRYIGVVVLYSHNDLQAIIHQINTLYPPSSTMSTTPSDKWRDISTQTWSFAIPSLTHPLTHSLKQPTTILHTHLPTAIYYTSYWRHEDTTIYCRRHPRSEWVSERRVSENNNWTSKEWMSRPE